MQKIRFFLLLLLTFSGSAAVLPQGQQQPRKPDTAGKEQEGFKIGVEVNMVTVPITVRKQEGGFLKGLSKDAFYVYEDGEPQEVVFFAQEGLPTRIAIVLDSSGSVRPEWGTIKYATKRFVENLKPDDEFASINLGYFDPDGNLITPNPPLVPATLFALVVLGVWSMYAFVISQIVGIWRLRGDDRHEPNVIRWGK